MNRCEICKQELPEQEESLCQRPECQDVYNMSLLLEKRIGIYVDFFLKHPATEESYIIYLTQTNMEKEYQRFIQSTKPPKSVTRRTWFQLNIARAHKNWPDEFGRLYGD